MAEKRSGADTARKRRSDAVYATNADRQRAYRRRRAKKRAESYTEALARRYPDDYPDGPMPAWQMDAQMYGILGNAVKKSGPKRDPFDVWLEQGFAGFFDKLEALIKRVDRANKALAKEEEEER